MAEKKSKITIYDISKEAGVSIATVSRVLNDSNNVNPKTREKITEVMEKMVYKPNAFARGLGQDTMKTIGILCADSSDTYLAKAVYLIEEALRQNNYDSLLCCTGYDFQNKQKSLDLLISKKVDAAILVGSNFLDTTVSSNNNYIKEAAKSIPIMLLNACFECQNVYSLFCDDLNATKSAVEFLIKKGRKKILYLYSSKSYSGVKKLEGYKEALKENKLSLSDDYIVYCNSNRDDVNGFVKTIEEVYEKGLRFDAVVSSEDYLAIAALKFAIKKGISVPKDLSIIGYNNSPMALMTQPEITSVDNRLEALSKQLVATLLGVLEGKEMPAKTEYKGILIERDSTES